MLDLNKVIVDLQTGELSESELFEMYDAGYLNNDEMNYIDMTLGYITEMAYDKNDVRDHYKSMKKYAWEHAKYHGKRGAAIGGILGGTAGGIAGAGVASIPFAGVGMGAGVGTGAAIGAGYGALHGGIKGLLYGHRYGQSIAQGIQTNREAMNMAYHDQARINHIQQHQTLQKRGPRPITPPAKIK